ncbi:CinA family protein [Pseudomonas syringae]|uniref:CinA family protein n=1 Tax=Pseudomonas syringae TaxID=317 RepID=UPI00035235A0|nr:CinA family protein [Pseudomonas syringae]EPF65656.1 CinA-like protein [Pseudomonas syringae pv. syringae SM]KZL41009.1 ompetence-damaged protein [Pseudomonas syringae pv. syringae]
MNPADVATYLKRHSLYLTTAESCTAGRIISLLAEIPHCGDVVESGYVVYSPEAKHRLLGVSFKTIENFNLTSNEVAQEMALGALRDSPANVVIATTGLCGTEDVDGIPAGTVCFAWGFLVDGRTTVFTRRHRFFGDRHKMQADAALYALHHLPQFHRRMLAGDSC